VVQDIYIRRVEKVDGALYSVEFVTFGGQRSDKVLTNSPDFPEGSPALLGFP